MASPRGEGDGRRSRFVDARGRDGSGRARRRTSLAAVAVAVALTVAGWGAQAAQAAPPRRLGVVIFHGPGEGVTRVMVMRAAKANHFQVIGGQQIDRTAKKLKVRLNANASFEAVARALGISAFATGEVSRHKATLTIRAGDGGAVADEASWTGADPRKLAAAVGKTFWKRLGPAIEKARAPGGAKLDVAAEDEAVAENTTEGPGDDEGAADRSAEPAARSASPTASRARAESAAQPTAPPADKRPSPPEAEDAGAETTVRQRAPRATDEQPVEPIEEALSFAVGPRYGTRSLSYTDDRYKMNSNYSLNGAPLVGADLDFFPAALSSRGALARFGVTGSFAYQLPVVKAQFTDGGPTYGTKSIVWSMGLKVRLPAGFFVTGGVGGHYYELADTATAVPSDVPMTNYQYIRAGAGVRRRASARVLLMAHGGYLHGLRLGQIGDAGYYPSATGAGFEAGVALGYLVAPTIELRGGVDVQRFGLAFHVTVDDFMNGARTAGGALDQYTETWLAIAFVLGAEAKAAPAIPTAPTIIE